MSAVRRVVGLSVFALTLAGLFLAGTAVSQAQDKQEPKKPAPKPAVDLVICLDTSNSMDGLIESVKTKLWDIVNELGKAKPQPHLRIALYAYGTPAYGRETGYVKKVLDFTDDLDMVYQKLFGLRTHGGDEYVARVTKAALDQQQWSKDPKALRMIFVCGNEPATQDPLIKLETVAAQAVRQNVIINTIYCTWQGTNAAEIEGWRKFAALSEGRFLSIDQNRGAVAINTPVDKKLNDLGQQLNGTYVWYGHAGEAKALNQAAQDQNAAKLGAGVQASRVSSKGGNFYRQADADLVDRVLAEPKFDIKTVAEKELPANLQKMKPAERVKYIEDQKNKRQTIQKEIADLTKQRNEFIRQHNQKNQNQAQRAFDDAVRGILRVQANNRE
jgi:hypothetical protein